MRPTHAINMVILFIICVTILGCTASSPSPSSNAVQKPSPEDTVLNRYYAHPKTEDKFGIVSPWYLQQNGQIDQRLKISVDVLKRFPWAIPPQIEKPIPHYVVNGKAQIELDGTIKILPLTPHENGDLINRAASALTSWTKYYSYSGDPSSFSHVELIADYILQNCLTSESDPWPLVPVSVPTRGLIYGRCDSANAVQLDLVAFFGSALLDAYKMTSNKKWLEYSKAWGDLFAQRANLYPHTPTWPRYTDINQAPPWEGPSTSKLNRLTGGVVYILSFLENLIETTNPPPNSSLRRALNAGEAYLRNDLLPQWTAPDTWGRSYWDYEGNEQQQDVVDATIRYITKNRARFPSWQQDTYRLFGLNINRFSTDPNSSSGLYSGAWQYPESPSCCGESLAYGPLTSAWGLGQFAQLTGDHYFKEISRRIAILSTYDATETGYSEDLIHGGQFIYKSWINIAHVSVIKTLLEIITGDPEQFAPNGENHLVKTASTVKKINYGPNTIEYLTFNSNQNTIDEIRLSFRPVSVKANGTKLSEKTNLNGNGYTIKELSNGDFILKIRHDMENHISIEGQILSHVLSGDQLKPHLNGQWTQNSDSNFETADIGSSIKINFQGNQVYLESEITPEGGYASVKLDGDLLLNPIDFWGPHRHRGIVWSKTGLTNTNHTLEIYPIGNGNPLAIGRKINVYRIWWIDKVTKGIPWEYASPSSQRVILGYSGRENPSDENGHQWQLGADVLTSFGTAVDTVEKAWWTRPISECPNINTSCFIQSFGLHAPTFTYGFTVSPGTYDLTIYFNCRRLQLPNISRMMTITANDYSSSIDLGEKCESQAEIAIVHISDIHDKNGTVQVKFQGEQSKEAFASSMELQPSTNQD